MGTMFLPIVFSNIPGFFGKTYFAGFIWIILISVFHKKIVLSKNNLVFIFYFLILYLGSKTIWFGRIMGGGISVTPSWIFRDIFGALISIQLYSYFVKTKDYKGLALVTKITLIFIVITAGTSIIGLLEYPEATRVMASSYSEIDDSIFLKQGIGNYNFFGSFIFLFPVIVYSLKKKIFNVSNKLIYLGILILFVSLVLANFTTALMLSIAFFLYSFFINKRKMFLSLFLALILILSFFVLNGLISEMFYFTAKMTSNSNISGDLQNKLIEIGRLIEFLEYDKTSNLGGRVLLSLKSIDKFLENPIIGGGWGGGHSTWLDRLGFFWFIGFFPLDYNFPTTD